MLACPTQTPLHTDIGQPRLEQPVAVWETRPLLCARPQELNSSTPARAPCVGLTGMQTLKPFVAGLIVSDGELQQACSMAAATEGSWACCHCT